MFAIIETGGKQYKVQEGDVLYIEKLNANEGEDVTFDRVLAVSKGDESCNWNTGCFRRNRISYSRETRQRSKNHRL